MTDKDRKRRITGPVLVPLCDMFEDGEFKDAVAVLKSATQERTAGATASAQVNFCEELLPEQAARLIERTAQTKRRKFSDKVRIDDRLTYSEPRGALKTRQPTIQQRERTARDPKKSVGRSARCVLFPKSPSPAKNTFIFDRSGDRS